MTPPTVIVMLAALKATLNRHIDQGIVRDELQRIIADLESGEFAILSRDDREKALIKATDAAEEWHPLTSAKSLQEARTLLHLTESE